MGKDRSLDNTTTYFGFIWKVANNNNNNNNKTARSFFFLEIRTRSIFFYLALSHMV